MRRCLRHSFLSMFLHVLGICAALLSPLWDAEGRRDVEKQGLGTSLTGVDQL
jgi:hypothetical protein